MTTSSVGAMGITQTMPLTAISPGFGVAPLVPMTPEITEAFSTYRAASAAHRAEANPQTQGELQEATAALTALVRASAETVPEAEFIRFGRDYLDAMLERYGGDLSKALGAYNWGPGRVDAAVQVHGNDWLDHAPSETQSYVRNILARSGM